MNVSDYKQTYQKALAELSDLMERREQLEIELEGVDTRIGEVRQGIKALSPLCQENPYTTRPDLFPEIDAIAPDVGLTDAIRKVLTLSNPNYLSPVGVRAGLEAIGFEIKSKNILPSIHTILKRLDEKKEVMTQTVEGRTWYRWNAPSRGTSKSYWSQSIDMGELLEAMRKASGEKPKMPPPQRGPKYEPVSMVDDKGKPKKVSK